MHILHKYRVHILHAHPVHILALPASASLHLTLQTNLLTQDCYLAKPKGQVCPNPRAKRKPPTWLQQDQEPNESSKEDQDERYLGNQAVANNDSKKIWAETNTEASQISGGALTRGAGDATPTWTSMNTSQPAMWTTWTGTSTTRRLTLGTSSRSRCSRTQGRWSQRILIKEWDREHVL